MKLRIKLSVQPAATHRVEVPNDATLGDLQRVVATSIPALQALAADSIKLSLNNKVALAADAATRVVNAGVCNGDALWVLNAVEVPSTLAAHSNGQGSSGHAVASGITTDADSVSKRQRPDTSSGSNMGRHDTQGDSSQLAAPQHLDTGSSRTAMDVEQQSVPTGTACLHGTGTAETSQERVQHSTQSSTAHVDEDQDTVDAQAELLPQHVEEHKGTLPQGPVTLQRLLSSWQQVMDGCLPANQQLTSSVHQLLLLTVHAAMQEAGFNLVETSTATTAAPAMLQALCLPPHGPAFLKYMYGHLAGQSGALCNLRAFTMGPYLVVHAAVAQQIKAPEAATTATAAVQSAGDSKSSTATNTVSSSTVAASISLDTRVALRAGVTAMPQPCTHAMGIFSELKVLWIRLHDGLVSPCVNAVFRSQGLEPPRGLMYLPFELKDLILKQLKALDLARLSGACVELRHLASENRYWEPLFNNEFPCVSQAVRNAAALHGFKAAYAAAWKARKERSMRRAPIYPLMPAPMPSPWNPFIPPAPTFPQNIIGGDYDRLPALPGHMTIGSGMPTGMMGGMFSGPAFGGGRLQPRQGGVQGPGGLFGGGRGRANGGHAGMWG